MDKDLTEIRLSCLEAALRTPGISHHGVTKQAQEYHIFLMGKKIPEKKPAKRSRK